MKRYRKVIQLIILTAVLVIGGFVVFSNTSNPTKIPKVGDTAPNFKLQSIDGQSYQLSDLKGKIVLVNFWGTYCPPCVREMPLIEQMSNEYRDQNFIVLAINEDDAMVSIRGFVRQHKLTFPILIDDNMIRREYGVSAYPASFFVDPKGKIAAIHNSEMDERYMRSTIELLLAQ